MRSSLRNLVLAMLLGGPLVGSAQVATNIPERVVELLQEIRDGNDSFAQNLQDYLTYGGTPDTEYLLDNLFFGLQDYFGPQVPLGSRLQTLIDLTTASRNFLEPGARFWSYLNTNRLSEIETDIIRTRNASEESKLDLDELVYILEHYTFNGGALLVQDISRGDEIGGAVEVLRGFLQKVIDAQIDLRRSIARITDQDIAAPTGETSMGEALSSYQSIDYSSDTNEFQSAESEVEFTRSNVELDEPSLTGEMFNVPHATEFEPVQSTSVISLIPRDVYNNIGWNAGLPSFQPASLEVSITSNQQLSGWIDSITGLMQDVWSWAGTIVRILIAIAVYRPFLRDMLQPQGRLPI